MFAIEEDKALHIESDIVLWIRENTRQSPVLELIRKNYKGSELEFALYVFGRQIQRLAAFKRNKPTSKN